MKASPRRALPARTARYLSQRRPKGATQGELREDAERLWRNFGATRGAKHPSSRHRVVVQATLRSMNGGAEHCMYCERDTSTHLDHFVPRSLLPECVLEWRNLVWSCHRCNIQKGSSYSVHLIDPTAPGYRPLEHFALNRHSGAWVLRSAASVVSERVYALNDPALCLSRQAAFDTYQALIIVYHLDEGTPRAEGCARAIRDVNHRSVLQAILMEHDRGNPDALLNPRTSAALVACPEIRDWL